MCDFSLQSVRSRPAQVGDKLVTQDFGTGTRGFAAADDRGLAVCVLPGTELAFAADVACLPAGLLGWKAKTVNHQTAIFRQVNKDKMAAHHDALEFPDGRIVLLTLLCEGQPATVLQLPARPTTAEEARDQERVSYVGLNALGRATQRAKEPAAALAAGRSDFLQARAANESTGRGNSPPRPFQHHQVVPPPGEATVKQLTLLSTIFWLSAMKLRPSSLTLLIHSLSHS